MAKKKTIRSRQVKKTGKTPSQMNLSAGEEVLKQIGMNLEFFKREPTDAHRLMFSLLQSQLGESDFVDPLQSGPAKYAEYFDALMSEIASH